MVYLGEVIDLFKVVGCETVSRLGEVLGPLEILVLLHIVDFLEWIWIWSLSYLLKLCLVLDGMWIVEL